MAEEEETEVEGFAVAVLKIGKRYRDYMCSTHVYIFSHSALFLQ